MDIITAEVQDKVAPNCVKGASKTDHCGGVKPYHWDEASRL